MPSNNGDYMREYMRAYRAEGRDTGKVLTSRAARLPFVGCDGEGWDLDNGYHAYFMFRIGDEVLRPVGSHVRLTTWQCLDFIARQDPNKLYVGYFFDYDVTKMLEDLPWDKLSRLIHRAVRTHPVTGQLMPVDYMGFQLEYLPHKEFKVRKWEGERWSAWVVINDVGTFFQCSFLDAIKTWGIGTPLQHQAIDAGKKARAEFALHELGEIEEYNAMEIELLQALMDRFRESCISAGYIPSRWQGPGVLAETMLRKHGVPKSAHTPLLCEEEYTGLLRFGTSAYYGGRFEVSAVGPVNRVVYQYDINSAYPYAMLHVPCLMHGKWEYGNVPLMDLDKPTGRVGERYGLVFGSFDAGESKTLWYGLPMRSPQGTILFPGCGTGWYWSFEIRASVHQEFTPTQMWIYTRTCECKPLGFVEEIYATRLRMGKEGPGYVLKLGMNSLYGKTVQSIGRPKYANPIWGSFLTAFTRTQIQDFIHGSPYCESGECGKDVVMVATDSVASLIERPEHAESKTLGGWSKEIHAEGIFTVQPGVYFGTSGKRSKTRGVPRAIVDAYETAFREAFDRMVSSGSLSDGDVVLPQKIFVGIRYALHRRNTSLLGQWIEFGRDSGTGKTVSFDWTTKRVAAPALKPNSQRSYIQTYPYQGSTSICTVPYSKDIGGLVAREEARMAFEGQPDWTGVMYDDISV